MLIPMYFRYGEGGQFIGEIMIDESNVSQYDEFYEYDSIEHKKMDIEKIMMCDLNSTFYCDDIDICKFSIKYYDINLNLISINEIKQYTHICYEYKKLEYNNPSYDLFLYKSLVRVCHDIIYDLYFNPKNNNNIPIFIVPTNTSSVLYKYNSYGFIIKTFFHSNWKKNGMEITYEYRSIYDEPYIITYMSYVDGKIHGEYTRINTCNNIIEKGNYKNDKKEGEFIFSKNNKILDTIIYEDNNIKSIKNTYNDGTIKLYTTFIGQDLNHSISHYISGIILLETTKKNGIYNTTHYFPNGKLAWKISFIPTDGNYIIHEMYDNFGNNINEIEFTKKYRNKTRLLPIDILHVLSKSSIDSKRASLKHDIMYYPDYDSYKYGY